ncbi:MAG: N-acetyltransferase [Myxococcales bacterium]|nr:N-acetyltransferase [Myxococcales bacterium]
MVPRARRQGVGQSLLAHITNVPGPFVARCDVAHTRARRFLTHRAFELVGLVMHQRWDGGPEDVPRRFASGLIVEAKTDADFSSARELLLTAALEAGPLAMRRGSVMAPAWVLIASRGGRPVGVSVARRDREGWSIDSLAISSDARGLGIGRQLLCTLMERAAEEGQGVCLCLSPEYPRVLDFTSRLGFWTYRTSADFRRGSRSPTVATDTGYGDAPTT